MNKIYTCWLTLTIAGSVCVLAEAQTRFYYVTTSTHQGNSVLSACAEGYHVASITELQNPSALTYDTTSNLGNHSRVDHGHGFGLGYRAWVRSGYTNDSELNCNGWTSNEGSTTGIWAELNYNGELLQNWPGVSNIQFQWTGGKRPCDIYARVYCVADPVLPIKPEILYCNGFESCPTQ